jgi:DNA repair exonuclease SbcCD ATPase subunit
VPKIEYLSLEFENAYIYQRCVVPLKDQGLVLVRGLNLDDGGYLGAGKSSIFEVFAQLQVGKCGKNEVRGGISKDDIVNHYQGTDFYAKLSLTVDGHPYDLIQYRKHQRHGNRLLVLDRETGENILPKGVGAASYRWIGNSVLGMDDVTFFNLVYLAQEFSSVMIHGSESDRRKQLTRMFNLHIYDDLYDLTRRDLEAKASAATDFETIQVELQEVTERLSKLQDLDHLSALLSDADQALETVSQQVQADMQEYQELSTLLANAKLRRDLILEVRELYKQTKWPPQFTRPQDITQAFVSELKQQYDNLHAEQVTVLSTLETVQHKTELEHELKRLTGREAAIVQQELTEAKSRIRLLQTSELPQAEERVEVAQDLQRVGKPSQTSTELDRAHTTAVEEETRLKTEIATLHSQVANEVCPTCHRPFHVTGKQLNEMEQRLFGLRAELEGQTKLLHELRQKRDQATKYQRLLDRYKATLAVRTPEEIQLEINQLVRKEKVLTTELEQAQRRLVLQGQLRGLPSEDTASLETRAASLKLKLEVVNRLHRAASTIVDKVRNLVKLPQANLEDLENRMVVVKQRLDQASDSLKTANQVVTNLSGQVDEHRRLVRRRTTLAETLTKRKALIQEITCLRALKRAFDPKGLKQDRFRSLLTDATQRTVPLYANILWPNRTVALSISDREGSIQFQLERENTATSSSLLSGGERHKSGLAFLFGMRDLKELYTGCSTNLLIVDEPFGSLDPQGTESLISLFELMKQRFGTIFVISHRPEVLENPIWDQTWWVVRERNNAQLYCGEPPAKYRQLAAELART